MISGSCLCGEVTYSISATIGDITHCHCSTCRKAHSAAFSSVAAVQAEQFAFLSGEPLVKSYESSPGKLRYFCSGCGSQLYAHRTGLPHYILRLGTLDDDPGVRPVEHIWLSDKAVWFDPKTDGSIPMYQEWADDR